MTGLILLSLLVLCILMTLISVYAERREFEQAKARKLRMIKGDKK